jgi:hypothetical protein
MVGDEGFALYNRTEAGVPPQDDPVAHQGTLPVTAASMQTSVGRKIGLYS